MGSETVLVFLKAKKDIYMEELRRIAKKCVAKV
jgi:hypothetical protein